MALRLLGHHVGAQLDAAPERAVLDLDLLEQPALGLLGAPLARDQQLAPADLQRHVLDQHAGEVGLHHRPRRVVRVVDVHARREPAPAEPGALEHVAEQLVDLAPHALEVGEQVPLGVHARA